MFADRTGQHFGAFGTELAGHIPDRGLASSKAHGGKGQAGLAGEFTHFVHGFDDYRRWAPGPDRSAKEQSIIGPWIRQIHKIYILLYPQGGQFYRRSGFQLNAVHSMSQGRKFARNTFGKGCGMSTFAVIDDQDFQGFIQADITLLSLRFQRSSILVLTGDFCLK